MTLSRFLKPLFAVFLIFSVSSNAAASNSTDKDETIRCSLLGGQEFVVSVNQSTQNLRLEMKDKKKKVLHFWDVNPTESQTNSLEQFVDQIESEGKVYFITQQGPVEVAPTSSRRNNGIFKSKNKLSLWFHDEAHSISKCFDTNGKQIKINSKP